METVIPLYKTENIGSPALKLRFPRCDLIGVDIELLRKLRQGSVRANQLEVTKGDEMELLTENQSTHIPLGKVHSLANPEKSLPS